MFAAHCPILEGDHVRLALLSTEHAAALYCAGRDPSGWEFSSRGPFQDEADARNFIAQGSADPEAFVFGIWDRSRNEIVGTTRFFDIRRVHRGLEIGHTWIASSARRTAVNTECKRLLLAQAFEGWGAYRVQLKTDLRNVASQRAIERLGAVREGVLRRHMVVREGFVRDTVMYSITDTEWPAVRSKLEEHLARHRR